MKKNLITVLKKLLAAFGGEETQSNNAVEVIDKIADAANGVTAKELPEATAADAGKAVMVDENGEYALAEAGEGKEFVVTIQVKTNGPTLETLSCNATGSEICVAVNEGKSIRCTVRFNNNVWNGVACMANTASNTVTVYTVAVTPPTIGLSEKSQVNGIRFTIAEDGTITMDAVNGYLT